MYVIVAGIQTPHSGVFMAVICVSWSDLLYLLRRLAVAAETAPHDTRSAGSGSFLGEFLVSWAGFIILFAGCVELRCKRRDHHMTALPAVSRDFRFHTTTLARHFRPSRDRAEPLCSLSTDKKMNKGVVGDFSVLLSLLVSKLNKNMSYPSRLFLIGLISGGIFCKTRLLEENIDKYNVINNILM